MYAEGIPMAWKQTGRPTIQKHRDKWVVRVEGIDPRIGRRRPKQVGTYTSKRAAQAAAMAFVAAGESVAGRDTVAGLVDRWVASKVDVGSKTRLQYEWAAGHIRDGFGGVRVDQLDRADVARWLDGLAGSGRFARRSIQIFRMVLRAALADAVDVGELRRSPAARVPLPKQVVKPPRVREADAWTDDELDRFLTTVEPHRWGAPLRLCATYGLRRSEMLGLGWSAVDLDAGTIRIEHGLVEVHGRPEWTAGKNERSRRTIPIDPTTVKSLAAHRRFQEEERVAAGTRWHELDLVVMTHHGNRVSPGNFDQTLERLVKKAGVPRLTSHGLRHTAATHMVKHAADVGEIRAIADILGHSPDELMRTYAHALPESVRTVTDKIERRLVSRTAS
jgi:integrase